MSLLFSWDPNMGKGHDWHCWWVGRKHFGKHLQILTGLAESTWKCLVLQIPENQLTPKFKLVNYVSIPWQIFDKYLTNIRQIVWFCKSRKTNWRRSQVGQLGFSQVSSSLDSTCSCWTNQGMKDQKMKIRRERFVREAVHNQKVTQSYGHFP